MHRKIFSSKYLLVILVCLGACREKPIDPVVQQPGEENPLLVNSPINSWIHAQMKDFYLWEKDMREVTDTDLTLPPDEYFESILVNPGVLDRFSWIQESSENLRNSLNGLTSIFGFKYKPFYADAAKTRITYSITYSVKNSAADRAGIKRGDFITKVNGQDLTIENYTTALNSETASFTMGTYNNGTINHSDNVIELTKEVTQTEALQYYTILELGGKKIGYFVYNQFLTSSDKKVNDMFGVFKSAGIDELVVDFRYNPGGYISSAEMISSLIVKDLSTDKLMTRQVWNDKQMAGKPQSAFDSYFFTSKNSVGGLLNNPGTLDRVYFLVSNSSASASELVINNLKPYMEVVLVGEHTYGKNVGSITIDDDRDPKRWEWGMQPIVLKSFNADGKSDYGTKNGFAVDIAVEDRILPFRSFGDPDETLLNAALSDILGVTALANLKKSSRKIPSGVFEPAASDAIYGDPFLDRKEMWITEFPWDKK